MEDSSGAGSKGLQNALTLRRVQKHHRASLRVRFTEFLQDSKATLSILFCGGAEDENIDSLGAGSGCQTRRIQVRTHHVQTVIAAESLREQRRVERRVVGNENTDGASM